MKARQQSGLLSPKCQERRPAGPLVAATLASSFPHSLWKQTDQKLTCEKIRKLPVLGMTLRVSRVRRLRDGMARACLQDSHPVYTGLLPTHCIQSPHFPFTYKERSQSHKRHVISASMESAVLSLRAPPYLQTFPDISKGLQVGSVKPTLEPQIFNNNFHKSWCLLAGRRNPRASHPWTYSA